MVNTRGLSQLVCVLFLALAVTACGSEDEPAAGDDPSSTSSATASSSSSSTPTTDTSQTQAAAERPLVRLTKVTYNGNPQYEFSYTSDGEPAGYQNFHPVTGELSQSYVVEEVGPEGRVTESTRTGTDGTTATVSYEYDDAGRLVSRTLEGDSVQSVSTYAYDGRTVTETRTNGSSVYELDDDGNIMTATTSGGETTTTTTYLTYDDAPNPFTLTGGLAAQVWSTNNPLKWTPDAGCEYTEKVSYEDDLLVASRGEGCGGIVHDYVYEYAEY